MEKGRPWGLKAIVFQELTWDYVLPRGVGTEGGRHRWNVALLKVSEWPV